MGNAPSGHALPPKQSHGAIAMLGPTQGEQWSHRRTYQGATWT